MPHHARRDAAEHGTRDALSPVSTECEQCRVGAGGLRKQCVGHVDAVEHLVLSLDPGHPEFADRLLERIDVPNRETARRGQRQEAARSRSREPARRAPPRDRRPRGRPRIPAQSRRNRRAWSVMSAVPSRTASEVRSARRDRSNRVRQLRRRFRARQSPRLRAHVSSYTRVLQARAPRAELPRAPPGRARRAGRASRSRNAMCTSRYFRTVSSSGSFPLRAHEDKVRIHPLGELHRRTERLLGALRTVQRHQHRLNARRRHAAPVAVGPCVVERVRRPRGAERLRAGARPRPGLVRSLRARAPGCSPRAGGCPPSRPWRRFPARSAQRDRSHAAAGVLCSIARASTKPS